MELTRSQVANMIDHTNLKAFATKEDFITLCQQAIDNNYKMVAINSYPVKQCHELLKDTPVHVGAAIGFPLGQTTIETKVFETQNAIANGADEIDYLINITEVKAQNWVYMQDEMQRIVDVCKESNILVKVIFENCYLTKDEIKKMAEIAKEVKPDFIKTSTGFGPGGAVVEDVILMATTVQGNCQVKAAGAIRDWPTCKAMIDAGATRIGTSAGAAILQGFDDKAQGITPTNIATKEAY